MASASQLSKKYWETRVWREGTETLILSPFMGKSNDSIIVVKDALKAAHGSAVTIPIMSKLTGEPAEGDVQVVGNEQSAVIGYDTANVKLYTWSVRAEGKQKRHELSFNELLEIKDALKGNVAEGLEKKMIRILCGDTGVTLGDAGTAATTNHTWSDVGNALSASQILKAKAKAMDVGKLKPIKVKDGSEWLLGIISRSHAYDLSIETVYSNTMYYAADRGDDNPKFTGELKPYGGVILKVSDHIKKITATTAPWLLLGKQAAAWVLGAGPDFTTDLTTHYADRGTKPGYYLDRICAFKKIVNSTTSEDWGVYKIDSLVTDLTA